MGLPVLRTFAKVGYWWCVCVCVPGEERGCRLVVSLYVSVTQRCRPQCRTIVCFCSRVLRWSLH